MLVLYNNSMMLFRRFCGINCVRWQCRVRLDFIIPSRGLIGFQTEFLTMTSGTGLLYHTFDHYGPHKGGSIGERQNGVLISNATLWRFYAVRH
jgi:predicted membrane GTPase involved in stress response